MIASFGNSTLISRVKFPKLAIMTCGSPTCWAGGRSMAEWRRHFPRNHTKPDHKINRLSRCNERDHTYVTYSHR